MNHTASTAGASTPHQNKASFAQIEPRITLQTLDQGKLSIDGRLKKIEETVRANQALPHTISLPQLTITVKPLFQKDQGAIKAQPLAVMQIERCLAELKAAAKKTVETLGELGALHVSVRIEEQTAMFAHPDRYLQKIMELQNLKKMNRKLIEATQASPEVRAHTEIAQAIAQLSEWNKLLSYLCNEDVSRYSFTTINPPKLFGRIPDLEKYGTTWIITGYRSFKRAETPRNYFADDLFGAIAKTLLSNQFASYDTNFIADLKSLLTAIMPASMTFSFKVEGFKNHMPVVYEFHDLNYFTFMMYVSLAQDSTYREYDASKTYCVPQMLAPSIVYYPSGQKNVEVPFEHLMSRDLFLPKLGAKFQLNGCEPLSSYIVAFLMDYYKRYRAENPAQEASLIHYVINQLFRYQVAGLDLCYQELAEIKETLKQNYKEHNNAKQTFVGMDEAFKNKVPKPSHLYRDTQETKARLAANISHQEIGVDFIRLEDYLDPDKCDLKSYEAKRFLIKASCENLLKAVFHYISAPTDEGKVQLLDPLQDARTPFDNIIPREILKTKIQNLLAIIDSIFLKPICLPVHVLTKPLSEPMEQETCTISVESPIMPLTNLTEAILKRPLDPLFAVQCIDLFIAILMHSYPKGQFDHIFKGVPENAIRLRFYFKGAFSDSVHYYPTTLDALLKSANRKQDIALEANFHLAVTKHLSQLADENQAKAMLEANCRHMDNILALLSFALNAFPKCSEEPILSLTKQKLAKIFKNMESLLGSGTLHRFFGRHPAFLDLIAFQPGFLNPPNPALEGCQKLPLLIYNTSSLVPLFEPTMGYEAAQFFQEIGVKNIDEAKKATERLAQENLDLEKRIGEMRLAVNELKQKKQTAGAIAKQHSLKPVDLKPEKRKADTLGAQTSSVLQNIKIQTLPAQRSQASLDPFKLNLDICTQQCTNIIQMVLDAHEVLPDIFAPRKDTLIYAVQKTLKLTIDKLTNDLSSLQKMPDLFQLNSPHLALFYQIKIWREYAVLLSSSFPLSPLINYEIAHRFLGLNQDPESSSWCKLKVYRSCLKKNKECCLVQDDLIGAYVQLLLASGKAHPAEIEALREIGELLQKNYKAEYFFNLEFTVLKAGQPSVHQLYGLNLQTLKAKICLLFHRKFDIDKLSSEKEKALLTPAVHIRPEACRQVIKPCEELFLQDLIDRPQSPNKKMKLTTRLTDLFVNALVREFQRKKGQSKAEAWKWFANRFGQLVKDGYEVQYYDLMAAVAEIQSAYRDCYPQDKTTDPLGLQQIFRSGKVIPNETYAAIERSCASLMAETVLKKARLATTGAFNDINPQAWRLYERCTAAEFLKFREASISLRDSVYAFLGALTQEDRSRNLPAMKEAGLKLQSLLKIQDLSPHTYMLYAISQTNFNIPLSLVALPFLSEIANSGFSGQILLNIQSNLLPLQALVFTMLNWPKEHVKAFYEIHIDHLVKAIECSVPVNQLPQDVESLRTYLENYPFVYEANIGGRIVTHASTLADFIPSMGFDDLQTFCQNKLSLVALAKYLTIKDNLDQFCKTYLLDSFNNELYKAMLTIIDAYPRVQEASITNISKADILAIVENLLVVFGENSTLCKRTFDTNANFAMLKKRILASATRIERIESGKTN